MNLKERAKASIAKAKKSLDQINEKEKQATKEQEAFAAQFKSLNRKTNSHGGEKIMNLTKSQAALLKTIAAIRGISDEDVLKGYAKEKDFQLTSDHADLMVNVVVGDLIPLFDPRDSKTALLASFTQKNLAGKNQETYLLENESIELLDAQEGEDAPDATWSEGKFSITATRAAISFPFTQELTERSYVDQMTYVQSKVNIAGRRGLMEGIINGQGAASPQQDSGYTAGKLGNKMPGIRAVMSANSKVVDLTSLTGSPTDLTQAAVEEFLASEGDLFAQNESEYVLLCGGREYRKLSMIRRGQGVTGANLAEGSIFAKDFNGVALHNISPFLRSVTGDGTGYSSTGFVSATSANNDYGVLILLRPSRVFYAMNDAKLEVFRNPKKNAWDVTYNVKVGWAFHVAELGRMLVHIGAALS